MDSYTEQQRALGRNCAQAVLAAFSDDEKTAVRIATCFGKGYGQGELCGAAAAGLMAIGLRYGGTGEDARKANEKAAAFLAAFSEEYGSCVCRELLEAVPEPRAFCTGLCDFTVELLKDML